MFHDLIEFIRLKFGKHKHMGEVEMTSPNEYLEDFENVESPEELKPKEPNKDNSISEDIENNNFDNPSYDTGDMEENNSSKHKKEEKQDKKAKKSKKKKVKKVAQVSLLSAFVACITLMYWLGITIDYAIADTIQMTATVISNSSNPPGFNIRFDIQVQNYQLGTEIGDEFTLSPNREVCDREHICFKMIVTEIKNKKMYLDFKDVNFPDFLSLEDFKRYVVSSGQSRYNDNLTLTGKVANGQFYISKIEVTK